MIVGVDTSFLLYFFAPASAVGVPLDSNDQPVTMAKERVAGLIDELEKIGATIIVSTPAMSELMIRSGVQAAQAWLAIMNKSKVFRVVPFDVKSAIEVAMMAGHAVTGEGGKDPNAGTYAKLKYDRMIVAVAHTEGASVFYSDDSRQRNIAQRLGMTVKGLADCIVPTAAALQELPFQPKPETEK
ncbi:PIN domain-containing protein [Phenylobacterium sp.]|uniref:PIN domain-containing protein n=1 Tax=Phenylobacterium sp. TaxID=1871053 RepID=UPI00286A879B|nr:PIN domain-containing protein [Phenylobacterium sp.]